MDTFGNILGGTIVLAGTLVLGAAIVGYPLMWLWNWLMPILFKLPEITFWQAVGVSVLSGLLFKSTSTTHSKSE